MHSNSITKLLLLSALLCLAIAQENNTRSIVIGPVIGKVTTTTARVLLEFNSDGPITVILTDPEGNQTTSERNVTASRPVVFTFDNLQANTNYTVTLNDSSINMTESYFSTLSGESGKLNFAVLSCMDRYIQGNKSAEADLWADMLRRIQNNEISYLLQTGDQVYMDDPFAEGDPSKPYNACIKIINETSPDQWESKKDELLEILRDEYRKTWSIPSVQATLAKIPSLTILDDHQIRDDWGYLEQDHNTSSPDYFYGTLARQVYYEYERQLREDVNFTDLSNYTQEYYYENLNDIGFFFLDYRGIRSWNRNFSQIGDTQLGVNQTQLLQEVLGADGAFANVSNFFLVSPLTVVFLVEELVRVGYFSNNDAQESWTYGYSDELVELLNTLRDWKLAKEGREVTILDGDVHMAGYTEITYDDDFTFLQFTTSSIASSAPDDVTFAAFDLIKEVENLVDPWTYEHHDWTNKFNYGIVIARNIDNAATAECYLVEASSDEEPEIINRDGSDIDEDEWNEIWTK